MCDAAPPHTPSALSCGVLYAAGWMPNGSQAQGAHPGVHSLLDLTETKNEGLQHRTATLGCSRRNDWNASEGTFRALTGCTARTAAIRLSGASGAISPEKSPVFSRWKR